jgi:protein-tyrosine phosphatase
VSSTDFVRPLPVPGTFNFRDLGGYRAGTGVTRSGVLMRSDALVSLGQPGREALHALNLRTAIDLREPVERELDPPDLADLEISVRSWPLVDSGLDLHSLKDLPDFYRELLGTCGERFAGAVRLLSRPAALPAVVFCSAGKDRTGLLCALILSALGVGDDDVAAEYALTESLVRGEFRARLVARAQAVGLGEQALAVKLGAPAELMLEVLAELRSTHGGAGQYLVRHGLRPDELDSLRAALVASPLNPATPAPWRRASG